MKIVLRVSRPKAAFVYPVPPAPRTAILVPWFQAGSHSGIRVFHDGWSAAAAYRPAAIAGTWRQMEPLLGHNIESLTHALIVLARSGDALLTMAQRQQLWRTFRVPVFEQIIGGNGARLAGECEAHDGLHLESPERNVAAFCGPLSIERSPCGCGRITPRFKLLEPMAEARAAAPSAL